MIDDKPLLKAQKALESAKLATARMMAAPTLAAREHEWRSFLNFLAQVGEKLSRGYRGAGGTVEPWIGQQIALRDRDELLRYLHQARHADQHSNQEAVEGIPGRRELIVRGDGPVHIDELRIEDGRVVRYSGSAPLEERVIPARMELRPVVNRGVQYAPPATITDPCEAASVAIQNYEGLLSDFRQRFAQHAGT